MQRRRAAAGLTAGWLPNRRLGSGERRLRKPWCPGRATVTLRRRDSTAPYGKVVGCTQDRMLRSIHIAGILSPANEEKDNDDRQCAAIHAVLQIFKSNYRSKQPREASTQLRMPESLSLTLLSVCGPAGHCCRFTSCAASANCSGVPRRIRAR